MGRSAWSLELTIVATPRGGSVPWVNTVGTTEQEQPGATPGAGTDVAGGQTTDFGGVEVGCRVRESEAIGAEAARARGFPVDAELEL